VFDRLLKASVLRTGCLLFELNAIEAFDSISLLVFKRHRNVVKPADNFFGFIIIISNFVRMVSYNPSISVIVILVEIRLVLSKSCIDILSGPTEKIPLEAIFILRGVPFMR
jgi:hypothetical protein